MDNPIVPLFLSYSERLLTMSKTIDFASASASLVSRLDRSASKLVKPTRDGIAACVRFILETGGIQDGRRKKGNEPAIPSTRQLLVSALIESEFCYSPISRSPSFGGISPGSTSREPVRYSRSVPFAPNCFPMPPERANSWPSCEGLM